MVVVVLYLANKGKLLKRVRLERDYKMRKNTLILIVLLGINIWPTHITYGFGNKITHPAITNKAVQSSVVDTYLKNQLGITNGIQMQLTYQPDWYDEYIEYRLQRGGYSIGGNNRTILEWLKSGSVIEDEDKDTLFFLPSIRPRHHFHNPIDNVGLDNKFDHPNYGELFFWDKNIYPYGFDVTGQSAIVWAIEGAAPNKEPEINAQSWSSARDAFYFALTDNDPLWREYYFSALFLDLGSVMHMIEDMGVPAHARNDFLFGHYRPPLSTGNDFENWVETVIEGNGKQSPWSGNGENVAFDKLYKYFDADIYNGSYLGDGVTPPECVWGLSECSNYQFLSLSTVFGCTGVKYQFPHPDIDKMLGSIVEGDKLYFNGSNYGVLYMARESYTYYRNNQGSWAPSQLVIDNTITTDDDRVKSDYANITIPRTIDYATGLLNYFFRGKLSIEQIGCIDDKIEITITNKSTNSGVSQILKGGTFTLYWDDSSGNRTQVSDFTVYQPGTEPSQGIVWNSETTQLNYDQPTKAVLNPPESDDIQQYILVYEGTISANTDSPDSDDSRQIATTVGKLCCHEYYCECEYRPVDCVFCDWFEAGKTPYWLEITFEGIRRCTDDELSEFNGTYCLEPYEDEEICFWSTNNTMIRVIGLTFFDQLLVDLYIDPQCRLFYYLGPCEGSFPLTIQNPQLKEDCYAQYGYGGTVTIWNPCEH